MFDFFMLLLKLGGVIFLSLSFGNIVDWNLWFLLSWPFYSFCPCLSKDILAIESNCSIFENELESYESCLFIDDFFYYLLAYIYSSYILLIAP